MRVIILSKSLTLLLISISIGPLNAQATFTTTGAGTTWSTGANWTCSGSCTGRTYPGEVGFTTDIVIVNHDINLQTGISPTIGTLTINNSTLNVRGLTGVPTLTASSVAINSTAAVGAEFNVYNDGAGSPTINITGNVTLTKNGTSTSPTRLKIGGDGTDITSSIVTIGGNLLYNYNNGHPTSSESFHEITVGSLGSVNDNCSLIVSGDVILVYNFATNEDNNVLAFEVGHSSSATMNNLHMQISESSGTGAGSDIRVATLDSQNASITVNGDATLEWSDGSAPNGGSDIYLKAGKDDNTAVTTISILGNLNMYSNFLTGTINVHARTSGSSTISVGGDLQFIASAATGQHVENRVELSDNSTFEIMGTIVNPLQGSFDFEPDGTAADNGTIKFSGNVAQNFPQKFQSSTSYYKNVTLDNSSGVDFTIPISTMNIEGVLTMTNGIINSTSTNQLVFEAGATSNGGSSTSYVTGPVKKKGGSNLIFPIGSGIHWAPLEISNIVSGASAVFTAEYFPVSYSNTTTDNTFDHTSKKEYWDLGVTGASPTLDLTLYWKDACFSVINDLTTGINQDLFIGHFNSGPPSEWNLLAGTYTLSGQVCGTPPASGSIKVTSVNSFSPFTFIAKDPLLNALPIILSDFRAELFEGDKALIKWVTESEENADYFIVEKSNGTESFYPIDTIPANGNTNERHAYEIIDAAPLLGINYYSLTQVDFDGTENNYKTISLEINRVNEMVSLYPVPSKIGQPIEVVTREDIENRQIKMKVYSSQGYDVTDKCEFILSGSNHFTLETTQLGAGVYTLIYQSNSLTTARRFAIH